MVPRVSSNTSQSLGLRLLIAAGLAAWTLSSAAADTPLFSRPLHLTREVSDSISQRTSTIEEYCEGNRVISIRGAKTIVADYGQQTITTIDRTLGTYSVARFDQVASPAVAAGSKSASAWRVRQAGSRDVAARTTTAFELEQALAGERRVVRVAATESVILSRAAVEILIGSAYPSPRREEAETLIAQLKVTSGPAIAAMSNAMYRLPLEEIFTFEIAGETAETRSTIVRVGNERAPLELASIPPGARRIEPESRDLPKLLQELDSLPQRR